MATRVILNDGLANTRSKTMASFALRLNAQAYPPVRSDSSRKPNMSKGMQYLLTDYASWCAKRRQRNGYLFQGRFKAELVETKATFGH